MATGADCSHAVLVCQALHELLSINDLPLMRHLRIRSAVVQQSLSSAICSSIFGHSPKHVQGDGLADGTLFAGHCKFNGM
eukprot:3731631-Pleurochrysis_carterae.AAC.2